ncbi:hypothetical protein HXX76_009212 [Chlamydomonas incerta]|uniref:U-box domain-containing protein n=1 Tax=Chlamydomonas incerta TaxID=51695 RepID=A0A835VZK4_CHLIN|nr:hypothetical protein HXX76_009212 [Chlamydomonas incerta]|eukprot:KAG2431713.1 hypothetical protein HXX76_009212 [Chlamydomonas incerta]
MSPVSRSVRFQSVLLFGALFQAASAASIVCVKPLDGTYSWNEATNSLGPSRCSSDCECAGARYCSSFGFCAGVATLAGAPPPPPRPSPRPPRPSPPPRPPSPPAPPAPPPPSINTRLSRYFCGSTYSSSLTSPSSSTSSNNPYRNITGAQYITDDAAARTANALLSITIRSSLVTTYEAWSTYRDLGRGPLHSAYNSTYPLYTINLTSAWSPTSPDRIAAVSACCYMSSVPILGVRSVTAYRLLFRTQSGLVRRLGDLSDGGPGLCLSNTISQSWEPVPAGYLLAGLATEETQSWDVDFSRIAFVFVSIPGCTDALAPFPPLPPLPPSFAYGGASRSGGSSSSGGSSNSAFVGIIVGVVVGVTALLSASIFAYVMLKRRAQRRFGSDEVRFSANTCSFYPRNHPASRPPPPPPPQYNPLQQHYQQVQYPPPPQPYPYAYQSSAFAAGAAAAAAGPGLSRTASGPAPTPRFVPSLRRQATLSDSIALQLQVLFGENAVIQVRPGAAELAMGAAAGGGFAAAAAAGPSVTVAVGGGSVAAPPPRTFTAAELAAATAGFAESRLLAWLPAPMRPPPPAPAMVGGGGRVYIGRLDATAGYGGGGGSAGGCQVAVWQIEDAPRAAVVVASAEPAAAASALPAGSVRRLAGLRHPHLLPLLGDCPDKLLLVYELAPSGLPVGATDGLPEFATLAARLAPPPSDTGAVDWSAAAPPLPVLGWRDRVRVGAEVAAVVAFLHTQTPPLFCRVPLDATRVVVDTATGRARLGFVALSGGGGGGGGTADMRAEAAAEDVRALGVLLLRLLTGDVAGGAAALEARVHSARQSDLSGGGGGRALASLVFDGAGGERWPAAEALAFVNAALRCCSASTSSGGSMGGAGPELEAAAAGGGPDLKDVVLPYLLQLGNRTRLYAWGQPPPHAAAAAHDQPPSSAAAGGGNGANGDAESADLPDDMPPLFLCPITQDVMEDPVVAADGFSYERAAIEQWIASSTAAGRAAPRSPMTNLAFEHKSLIPNRVLKSQIVAWREQQRQQAAAAQAGQAE